MREVIELCVKGSDKIAAYACGECRIVARTQALAKECCAPKLCKCGAEVSERWRTECDECTAKRRAEGEAAGFARATKVPESEWSRPVYWEDGKGDCGDGFFSSIEALREACAEEEREIPAYVWATRPMELGMDADDIIESALSDWYEDAGMNIGPQERKRLQAFLDEWCASQSINGFESDDGVAVVLAGEEVPRVD